MATSLENQAISIPEWFSKPFEALWVGFGRYTTAQDFAKYLNTYWQVLRPPRFSDRSIVKGFRMAIEMKFKDQWPTVAELVDVISVIDSGNSATHETPYQKVLAQSADDLQYCEYEFREYPYDSPNEIALKRWGRKQAMNKLKAAGLNGFKAIGDNPAMRALAAFNAALDAGKTGEEAKAIFFAKKKELEA